jgi:hypothetical protein
VNADEVAALRVLFEGTPFDEEVDGFATALGVAPQPAGGLLVVGTPDGEPWHFTAHLADEARWSGRPELDPTLVRWQVPPGAPAHLATGLDRLDALRRQETLLVVAPEQAPERLLDRLVRARRGGALVMAIDAAGDHDLRGVAHEALMLPAGGTYLDVVAHVVSQSAPHARRERLPLRERLGRTLDRLQGAPQPPRRNLFDR